MKNGHAPLAILAVMAFALMLPAAAEEKPTAPLRPHMGQVMFPYPPLNAVVMFGARAEDPAPASRPWKWNGREWEAFAGEAPAFHYWNAMAYDSRRQRLVAFGGKDKKQKGYGDFWEWDGGKWSAIAAKVLPPGRAHFALAYDEARGRTVLFGGHDGDAILGDTWEWDGSEWRRAEGPAPAPRCLHTMTYDPARKKIVLVGGSGDPVNRIVFSDVWEWDGTRWTEVKVKNPLRISYHAAAYNPAAGCLLVSGGFAVSHKPLAAAWKLRGDEWQRSAMDLPSPLEAHMMAWDPDRRQMVLFGGWGVENGKLVAREGTWIWDGSKWSGF